MLPDRRILLAAVVLLRPRLMIRVDAVHEDLVGRKLWVTSPTDVVDKVVGVGSSSEDIEHVGMIRNKT